MLVWLGSAVVTINAILLGSETLGFFQTVCLLGYSIAPFIIPAILGVAQVNRIVRVAISIGALSWALLCSVGFITPLIPSGQRSLTLYPLFMFYVAIAWFVAAK